jgi:radical SAM protein with 4Fe4S-binding SPASM domain
MPAGTPLEHPVILQVEITSRCNLKCKMCPLTTAGTLSGGDPGPWADAVWEQVRGWAAAVGRVNFCGYGEPFLHPEFLEYLHDLDARGVRTSFSTNGIAVTESTAAALADLRHLERVNVSIDSPDPAAYKKIRGGDVALALRGLRRLRTFLPADRLTVSSVVIRTNLRTLYHFPEQLAAIGVTDYVLQPLLEFNVALDGETPVSEGEFVAALHATAAVGSVVGVRVHHDAGQSETARKALALADDQPFTPARTRQCVSPWGTPFVDKDGRVFPCCSADGTAVLGNLNRNTLDEVWNGEAFERFRRDLVGGSDIPDVCRRCDKAYLGTHPYRRWAAEVLPDRSRLAGASPLRLVVRNAGTETWTRATPVRLATSGPRDRLTGLRHPSWLTDTRVCTFRERRVRPGETATFEFVVGLAGPVRPEAFQLVVEGECWLPRTTVHLAGPFPPPAVRPRWYPPRVARAVLRRAARLVRTRFPLGPFAR